MAEFIARSTSSRVARWKLSNDGGADDKGKWGLEVGEESGLKAEQSFKILSLKKFLKDVASSGKDQVFGNEGGGFLDNKALMVDQSLCDLSLCLEIKVRRY